MLKAFIFLSMLVAASPAFGISIHVEWGYTPPTEPKVTGFKLYQEGIYVCQTTNPIATNMDCDVTITKPSTDYTLTAAFADGTESPHSAKYSFVPAIVDPDPVIEALKPPVLISVEEVK